MHVWFLGGWREGAVHRWAVSGRSVGSMLSLPFPFKAQYVPRTLIPNRLFPGVTVAVRNVHHFPGGFRV